LRNGKLKESEIRPVGEKAGKKGPTTNCQTVPKVGESGLKSDERKGGRNRSLRSHEVESLEKLKSRLAEEEKGSK